MGPEPRPLTAVGGQLGNFPCSGRSGDRPFGKALYGSVALGQGSPKPQRGSAERSGPVRRSCRRRLSGTPSGHEVTNAFRRAHSGAISEHPPDPRVFEPASAPVPPSRRSRLVVFVDS